MTTNEPLAPTDKVARFHSDEIHKSVDDWWKQNSQ